MPFPTFQHHFVFAEERIVPLLQQIRLASTQKSIFFEKQQGTGWNLWVFLPIVNSNE
jgi:hypothetical protein